MLNYRIREANVFDSERIFKHKNRAGHRMYVIHRTKSGYVLALRSFAIILVGHVGTLALQEYCFGYDITWRIAAAGIILALGLCRFELFHSYSSTAQIMAYWLTGIRLLRGWLAFESDVGFTLGSHRNCVPVVETLYLLFTSTITRGSYSRVSPAARFTDTEVEGHATVSVVGVVSAESWANGRRLEYTYGIA